jgi:hypothetical protein
MCVLESKSPLDSAPRAPVWMTLGPAALVLALAAAVPERASAAWPGSIVVVRNSNLSTARLELRNNGSAAGHSASAIKLKNDSQAAQAQPVSAPKELDPIDIELVHPNPFKGNPVVRDTVEGPCGTPDSIKQFGCGSTVAVDPKVKEADVIPTIYFANQLPLKLPAAANQSPFADDKSNADENLSVPTQSPPPAAAPKDPCAAAAFRPLSELGINIATPDGQTPANLAGPCWDQINGGGCPRAGARCWPMMAYYWDATCLCYRPLYFEEANLERYGYSCDCCLQPFASAAHFFGTVPALPYCMAVNCPGECIYTLGHYRPGSCPPWRWQWPPCSIFAADVEAGVLAGLIFAIP